MKGQLPIAETRPLSENIAVSDIDKMLHDYVRPSFLKMSADKQKEAIALLAKMAEA